MCGVCKILRPKPSASEVNGWARARWTTNLANASDSGRATKAPHTDRLFGRLCVHASLASGDGFPEDSGLVFRV